MAVSTTCHMDLATSLDLVLCQRLSLLRVEMQVYSGWVNCHQSVSKAGWFDDFVRPSSW